MLGMGGPLRIKPIYTRKNWVFIGFQNPLLKGSNSGLKELDNEETGRFFNGACFFCREFFRIHDGWSLYGVVFSFFLQGKFEKCSGAVRYYRYQSMIHDEVDFLIRICMMVEFWLNVWGWWLTSILRLKAVFLRRTFCWLTTEPWLGRFFVDLIILGDVDQLNLFI